MRQTAPTSRNPSCHACSSNLPCGLNREGPKHWSELDVEKNRRCVWVRFLSSLIFTVVMCCVSQAGIFSDGFNVMIFIRTCPRLLDLSLSVSDIIVLDTKLCLHMTKEEEGWPSTQFALCFSSPSFAKNSSNLSFLS